MGITVDVYRNYILRAVEHIDADDAVAFSAAVDAAEKHILSTIAGLNLTESQKIEQVTLLNSALEEFRPQSPRPQVDGAVEDLLAPAGEPAAVAQDRSDESRTSAPPMAPAPPVVAPRMAERLDAGPAPRHGGHSGGGLFGRGLLGAVLAGIAGAAIVLGYQAFFQSDCRAFSCHDSGWRLLEGRADHVLTVEHGFGVPPVGVEVWFSPDEGRSFVRRHAASWMHGLNPVDTRADARTVSLHFYNGEPLHKVWTLAEGWVSYDRGYFRVIVRR
jgi:hypothetical protein